MIRHLRNAPGWYTVRRRRMREQREQQRHHHFGKRAHSMGMAMKLICPRMQCAIMTVTLASWTMAT